MEGDRFVKSVAAAIERHRLASPGDGMLVAVSGGPDSTALLDALATLADRYRWRLVVGHLDHGLRPQSEADARYVGELASARGLPCVMKRVDVTDMARSHRTSLEDAGRRARYGFYEEVACREGLARVALGHTLDDQAETVLLRLLRGAGVEGLAAMAPARPLGEAASVTVIRPLLEIPREEVLAYCARRRLRPCRDQSNEDLAYWRNRVRHLVLPLLEREFAPNAREILARTASIFQDEAALLALDTEQAMAAAVVEAGRHQVTLDRTVLAGQPRARARRVVRRALGLPGVHLGYVHVEAVLELALGGAEGAAVHLPGGLAAACRPPGLLTVACRQALEPALEATWQGEVALRVPGDTAVPELGVRFRTRWLDGEEARQLALADLPPGTAVCDARALEFPLTVRTRREGDRFRPLGMKGTRKLKDFLMGVRVPRERRDRVPLVVSGGQILWVAGYRLDDRFRVTADTPCGLRLDCDRVPGPGS